MGENEDGTVLWDGNPDLWNRDPRKAFGNVETDGSATLTAENDPDKGTLWKLDKPSGSNRCESRNVRIGGYQYSFSEGRSYYFGWSSKVTSTERLVTFQWKSYPNGQQNYPVLMEIRTGTVRLHYVAPGEQWNQLWTHPVAIGEWNDFVVGIHASSDEAQGTIDFWFNGSHQVRQSGRTWDTRCEPKWGCYSRHNPEIAAANYIANAKIGTSYEVVAPPR